MKKFFIIILTIIDLSFAADISNWAYLIGETIACESLNNNTWLCFDFRSRSYCDIPQEYYIEYSEKYGWEINWLGGYTNECIGADHTTIYWEYRISNDNIITEYYYHIDKDYNKILEHWRKNEVSISRANKQRKAIIDLTNNKWFDRNKI